jgi:hypothetical protein
MYELLVSATRRVAMQPWKVACLLGASLDKKNCLKEKVSFGFKAGQHPGFAGKCVTLIMSQ